MREGAPTASGAGGSGSGFVGMGTGSGVGATQGAAEGVGGGTALGGAAAAAGSGIGSGVANDGSIPWLRRLPTQPPFLRNPFSVVVDVIIYPAHFFPSYTSTSTVLFPLIIPSTRQKTPRYPTPPSPAA